MSDEQGNHPPPIPPAPGTPLVPPPPGTWQTAPTPAAPFPQPYPVAPQHLQPRSTNGFAVASLVLGIIWFWGVTSVLALIFGLVARRQIAHAHGWQTGDGLAIAGIVLGIVGIAAVVVLIIAAATAHFTY